MAGKRKRDRRTGSGRPKKRSRVMPMVAVPAFSNQKAFVPRSFGNAMSITERKYFDADLDTTSISTVDTSWAGTEVDPTTANTLFFPIQGDDINNRQGRKVAVLRIQVRGTVQVSRQIDQTGAEDTNLIRIYLYQDKQTNAVQSQGEEVIASGALMAIDMFQNTANFGRFRILGTRLISLSNPAITYDGTNIEQNGLIKHFKFNIKFRKPVIVHYNAGNSTATVAAVIDNSFHMIAACRTTTGTPSIRYRVRTVYEDQ